MFDRNITQDNGQEIHYCFQNNNLSCIKKVKPREEYIVLYTFIFSLSVFTVFLNLLVIVSISHFKKLHTPTNLLILSLAVTDLIVGLIVIPLMGIRFIESCWYIGEALCSLFLFIVFTVVSASLGNLVLISVDRYIAVSDPLRYTVRVTTNKVVFCIIINWLCSAIYSVIILHNTIFFPDIQDGCYGECTVSFKFDHVVTDLIITLVAPCSVIMFLYVKIFFVAKYQAKIISSSIGVSRSERKAAKTLGIVVVVYFLCWIPYYIVLFIQGETESIALNVTCWIVYMNSCMNPLIYALFYRWFRISAKCILTLKIFEPSSVHFNLFSEDK